MKEIIVPRIRNTSWKAALLRKIAIVWPIKSESPITPVKREFIWSAHPFGGRVKRGDLLEKNIIDINTPPPEVKYIVIKTLDK